MIKLDEVNAFLQRGVSQLGPMDGFELSLTPFAYSVSSCEVRSVLLLLKDGQPVDQVEIVFTHSELIQNANDPEALVNLMAGKIEQDADALVERNRTPSGGGSNAVN